MCNEANWRTDQVEVAYSWCKLTMIMTCDVGVCVVLR